MERTFEDLYTELVEETGDDSASKLVQFKAWINAGVGLFQGKLKIQDTEQERRSTTVALQARYQKPEDARRIKGIRFYDGSQTLPLTEVIDDAKWQRMNSTTTAATGVPTHWHKIGEDMYELYPVPGAIYTNGIILNCKIKQKPLSAANYTTGTASVAANGVTVTGSGTTFTDAMIGRRFRFADGAGNGVWYRITAVADTTHLTIENNYSDALVSGKAFIIAEIPELPRELHSSIYDYAYWRWLLGKREVVTAREFKGIWQEALNSYQPDDDTEEQVFGPEPETYIDDNVMQVYDRAY